MATILIADDTPSEAALMASVVTKLGHEAQTVGDGETCLRTARTLKPALILLDVVMPKLDGYQTCRRLRKDPEVGSVPVIMVSSKDQESDRYWGEKQGATRYVTKPFTPDTLAEAIQACLPVPSDKGEKSNDPSASVMSTDNRQESPAPAASKEK